MFGGLLVSMFSGLLIAAFPASTNYRLQSWGVNSGGTNSATSSTYSLQGNAGEVSGQTTTSASYKTNNGSEQAQQASVPPAPALSNGSGAYYNKLQVTVINTANPSDATFAIQESTQSDFSSFNYVQADGTLNSGIVWQNYSSWGSGSGITVTGLSPSTIYYFRVAAQEGKFTASAFGPSANTNTVNPALTFSVSPSSIDLGRLTNGSIITDTSPTFTFTTNAANGGIVYIQGSDTGLKSPSNSNYIIQVAPPSGDLTSLSEGFGFQGSTSGLLTTQTPYSNTGTVVGAIYTTYQPLFVATGPVSASPTTTGTVKAKSGVTTPPGSDYSDTLTFVATATF